MSDLLNLINALYTNFVLRDLFAKTVPGFILIGAVVASARPGWDFVAQTKALPLAAWLLLLGVGWLAGYAVQGLGERVGLFWTYLPADSYEPPARGEAALAKFHRELRKFRHSASSEADRRQFERFVVIREACGNGYLALTLALLFTAFASGVRAGSCGAWVASFKANAEVILALIVFTALLFLMHRNEALLQHSWMKGVLEEPAREAPVESKD